MDMDDENSWSIHDLDHAPEPPSLHSFLQPPPPPAASPRLRHDGSSSKTLLHGNHHYHHHQSKQQQKRRSTSMDPTASNISSGLSGLANAPPLTSQPHRPSALGLRDRTWSAPVSSRIMAPPPVGNASSYHYYQPTTAANNNNETTPTMDNRGAASRPKQHRRANSMDSPNTTTRTTVPPQQTAQAQQPTPLVFSPLRHRRSYSVDSPRTIMVAQTTSNNNSRSELFRHRRSNSVDSPSRQMSWGHASSNSFFTTKHAEGGVRHRRSHSDDSNSHPQQKKPHHRRSHSSGDSQSKQSAASSDRGSLQIPDLEHTNNAGVASPSSSSSQPYPVVLGSGSGSTDPAAELGYSSSYNSLPSDNDAQLTDMLFSDDEQNDNDGDEGFPNIAGATTSAATLNRRRTGSSGGGGDHEARRRELQIQMQLEHLEASENNEHSHNSSDHPSDNDHPTSQHGSDSDESDSDEDDEQEPTTHRSSSSAKATRWWLRKPPTLHQISSWVVMYAPCFWLWYCCSCFVGGKGSAASRLRQPTDRAILARLNVLVGTFATAQIGSALFWLIITLAPNLVDRDIPTLTEREQDAQDSNAWGQHVTVWNVAININLLGVIGFVLLVAAILTVRVVRNVNLVGAIRYLWVLLWVLPFEIYFVIGLFDYFRVTNVWVRQYWRDDTMAWFRDRNCDPSSTANTKCVVPIGNQSSEIQWCIDNYNATDCATIRDDAQAKTESWLLVYYYVNAGWGLALILLLVLVVDTLEGIISKPLVQKSRQSNVPAWMSLPICTCIVFGFIYSYAQSSGLNTRTETDATWIGPLYLVTAGLFFLAAVLGWYISVSTITNTRHKRNKLIYIYTFIALMFCIVGALIALFAASLIFSSSFVDVPLSDTQRGSLACVLDQPGSCTDSVNVETQMDDE